MALDLSREPVSLAVAKKHLGIRTDFRDDEIEGLIVGARERVEQYTGRALVRRVLVQPLETFGAPGDPVGFEFGPVHAVQAVRYLASGVLVDLAGAFVPVGPIGNRWRVYAADGWPILPAPGFAEVEYVAGFGEPSDEEEGEGGDVVPVPQSLVRAMLLLVGTWFENHEGAIVGTSVLELPFGVRDLCRDFRPSGVA